MITNSEDVNLVKSPPIPASSSSHARRSRASSCPPMCSSPTSSTSSYPTFASPLTPPTVTTSETVDTREETGPAGDDKNVADNGVQIYVALSVIRHFPQRMK